MKIVLIKYNCKSYTYLKITYYVLIYSSNNTSTLTNIILSSHKDHQLKMGLMHVNA